MAIVFMGVSFPGYRPRLLPPREAPPRDEMDPRDENEPRDKPIDERDGELERLENVDRLLDVLGREMLVDGRLGAEIRGAVERVVGALILGRLGADRLILGGL